MKKKYLFFAFLSTFAISIGACARLSRGTRRSSSNRSESEESVSNSSVNWPFGNGKTVSPSSSTYYREPSSSTAWPQSSRGDDVSDESYSSRSSNNPRSGRSSSSTSHSLCTVTFDYKTGSNLVITNVEYGASIQKPSNPDVPTGKVFYGWMDPNNGGQIWDFDSEVNNAVFENITLEPLFIDASLQENLLETELCPEITEANNGAGMDGATYSGGQKGKGMIYRGYNGEYGISGSFFEEDDGDVRLATESDPVDEVFGGCLHFNYIYSNTVSYEITSDAAVSDAVIFMRLSAEYGQVDSNGNVYCTFDDDMFQIKVNGTPLRYGEIKIDNIDPKWLMDFQDYYVKTTVSLKAGTNKIELVVNNNVILYGTIPSTAPCIDCLKLYTSSNITFDNALLDNLIKD